MSFIGMVFSYSIYLIYIFMFTFGVSCAGRASICFLYLMELLPKNRQVLIGTLLQIANSTMTILNCLYYWKISKDANYMLLAGAALSLISMCGGLLMPESPRFLITSRRYDQARVAVNRIARFNGYSEKFTGRFDREVEDLKSGRQQKGKSRRINNEDSFATVAS